jgi:signal transduction histidine kinase
VIIYFKKEDRDRSMDNNDSGNLEGQIKLKDAKIKELEEKLEDTERKLNELNKNLENRVLERTLEVNKLLRHKIKFIDSLSHDLGTPLTPLVALLPAIKEEISDQEKKDMLDTCIRNVEYLKRVVNNTRELAEVSSSDMLLKKENLFEIVEELHKKYDSIFKSCNITVENNVGQDVFVKTERSRLMKLFDHITSNAVNSMLDTGGKLTFESKPVKKESGTFIQISVKDTGVGLTRDQTDHLFDEFYKTDDSRHKLDSTGLGLAICKTIVEKHGGRIWADSHGEGTGVTIHFVIPSTEVVYTRSFL